jgi:hypothetical protein
VASLFYHMAPLRYLTYHLGMWGSMLQVGGEMEPNLRADGTKKWGPVLIEKRPSRAPRDGRTIIEKAQDRKKKANLEDLQGIPKPMNQFIVLSNSEISNVVARTGISLGSSVVDKVKSLDNIQCMFCTEEVG